MVKFLVSHPQLVPPKNNIEIQEKEKSFLIKISGKTAILDKFKIKNKGAILSALKSCSDLIVKGRYVVGAIYLFNPQYEKLKSEIFAKS